MFSLTAKWREKKGPTGSEMENINIKAMFEDIKAMFEDDDEYLKKEGLKFVLKL